MSGIAFDFNSYEGFDREFRLDTLEDKRTYLVIDSNGTHIRLTPSAYALLSAARSGISFDRLAQMFSSRARADVSAKQLTRSYEDLVRKLQVIQKSGIGKQRLPWGFWARLRLLPRYWVRSIASRLTFLFAPILAAILAPAIAASLVYCWTAGIKVQFTASSLAYSYALFLLSLLVHEFGHAAASQHYGAEPSEIGFAMYLIYPALYSDVTSAWRLSRWKRVIVDVGGPYFQLIVGCIFLAFFRLTGWQPLWAAFLMIIYTCIFSLNPIFKFDGYWVVADILGVTNLSKQPSRLLKHFWDVIRKRSGKPLPWPRSIIYVLILYSFASCAVWGSFIYKLVPVLYARIFRLSVQLESLHAHISSGFGPDWAEMKAILGSLYVLAILGISVSQLTKRAVKYLYKKIISRDPAPQDQGQAGEPIHPSSYSGLIGMESRRELVSHLSDGE
jgi:putative peptide zinc metalloprotease protein